MAAQQQTYANHAKVVPLYHYFTFGLVAVYFVYRTYLAITAPSMDNAMAVVLATALLMIFFWARLFALRVQDRVIRLEMHLRVANLAPDLSARFGEFTLNQLCAMRFASDAELPELARKVLSEKLDDRTAIKKMVRDWQADHARA
jgi:hypothetical protein